jgi:hypothetical protein
MTDPINPIIAQHAAEALRDALWPEGKMARRFTCAESDAIADFLTAILGPDVGTEWTAAHAEGDWDEDNPEHIAIRNANREASPTTERAARWP